MISLPELHLPGDMARVTDTAREAGRLLDAAWTHFVRGRLLTAMRSEKDDCPILETVTSTQMITVIEGVACPVKWAKAEKCWSPTILSKSQAEAILSAESFLQELPPIRGLTQCPILIENSDQLVEVSGYHRASGIYAKGRPVRPSRWRRRKNTWRN